MKKFENRRDSGDNINQANMSTGSEKGEDLIGMRFRYIDMFTKSGDSEYKLKGERDSGDSTIQGKGDSKSEQPKSEKKAKFVSDYLNQNPKAVEFYHNLIVNSYIKINKGDIDLNRLNELSDRQKLGSAELTKVEAELTKLTPAELEEKQALEAAYIGSIRYNRQLANLLDNQVQETETNLAKIADKFQQCLRDGGDQQSVLMEVCDGNPLGKSDSDLKKLHKAIAISLNASGWLYVGVRNALAKGLEKADLELDGVGAIEAATRLMPNRQYTAYEAATKNLIDCLDKGFPRKYEDTQGQAFMTYKWELTKQPDQPLEGTQNIAEVYKKFHSSYQALKQEWDTLLNRLTPNDNGPEFELRPTNEPDSVKIPEGKSTKGWEREKLSSPDVLKTYQTAFFGASPDTVYGSTKEKMDTTDTIIIGTSHYKRSGIESRNGQVEKIKKNGKWWEVTYENGNDKQTIFAKKVVLGKEARYTPIGIEESQVARIPDEAKNRRLPKSKCIEELEVHNFDEAMKKAVIASFNDADFMNNSTFDELCSEAKEKRIMDSNTFAKVHDQLGKNKKARGGIRIIFSGEKGAQGANFVAQGEGYGVTLIGINDEEKKGLYQYAPCSLAKMAVIEILKGKYPDKRIPKQLRAAIDLLDPTFRVEAAKMMSAVEAAKMMSARDLLREHLPEKSQGLVEEIEEGPIDLFHGLPPGGEVYNSFLKSVSRTKSGVTVILEDGQAITGDFLVYEKKSENSAARVLDNQEQEGLLPYVRNGEVVGLQTKDGSLKVLDTTRDPALHPKVHEILDKGKKLQELPEEVKELPEPKKSKL
jgi:hypothetical protein